MLQAKMCVKMTHMKPLDI